MPTSFWEGHQVDDLPADVVMGMVLLQIVSHQGGIFHFALNPTPMLYYSFLDFLCGLANVDELTGAPNGVYHVLGVAIGKTL